MQLSRECRPHVISYQILWLCFLLLYLQGRFIPIKSYPLVPSRWRNVREKLSFDLSTKILQARVFFSQNRHFVPCGKCNKSNFVATGNQVMAAAFHSPLPYFLWGRQVREPGGRNWLTATSRVLKGGLVVDLEKYQHILPARILLTVSIAVYQLVLITSSDRLDVLIRCMFSI